MTKGPIIMLFDNIRSRAAHHAGRAMRYGRTIHRLGRWKMRRWVGGLTMLGCAAAIIALGHNLYDVQGPVCSARFMQPHLSDFCGDRGWGNKPTHAERIAWEKLPPGDCDALARYSGQYETSPLSARAAEWHELHRPVRDATVSDYVRGSGGSTYVRQGDHGAKSRSAAEATARHAALDDAAANQCAPDREFEQLASVSLTEFHPQCRQIPGAGFFCGADYDVTCMMRGRRLREWCGPITRAAASPS